MGQLRLGFCTYLVPTVYLVQVSGRSEGRVSALVELTLCPHINSWAIVSPSKDGCGSWDNAPALGGETAVVTGCMGSDGRNSAIGWLLLMVQGGLQEKVEQLRALKSQLKARQGVRELPPCFESSPFSFEVTGMIELKRDSSFDRGVAELQPKSNYQPQQTCYVNARCWWERRGALRRRTGPLV